MDNVCKAIDRENKTHFSVSGFYERIGGNKNPDNARGIYLMVNCIIHYDGLLNKIKDGESEVVNRLSQAVAVNNNTISKFSFASKFCTYISRYQFNDDKYCIYDNVVQEILPYYIYRYLGVYLSHNYYKKTKSRVYQFKNSNDYEGYRSLIDDIINKSPLKEVKDKRKKFDLLLWYYYKGDNDLMKEAIRSIP